MAMIAFFAVLHCAFYKFEINFGYLSMTVRQQQLMVVGVCQDAEKVEIATAVKLSS